MPMFHIVDKLKGDKRIHWEPDNKKDISKVKKLFDQKLKDGYLAYTFDEESKQARQIREFDETADRIVLQPPMGGG